MDEPDSLGNHHYHSIGPPTDGFRRNDDSCCSHGGALDSGHLNLNLGHLPRKRERSPDDCPDAGNSGNRFLGDVPTLVDEKDGDCPHLFATNRKFSTPDGLAAWEKDVGKRSNQLPIVNDLQQLSHLQRGGMVCIKSEKSDVHRKNTVKVEHSVGTEKCQCVFGLEGDDEEDGGCKLNGICSKHNHELSTEKLRVIDKNERFSLQHLVKLIVECNYKTWNRTDPVTGTVNDILFGDQRSLALLQARPYVLAIYCTCNGNKMPFLEVVGFTSSYKSFSVVFAFLSLDAVENYVWALQNVRGLFEMNNLPLVVVTQKDLTLIDAVETVFPEARHLLLRQDIYKDVEEKCSKVANNKRTVVEFMKGWKCVVEATDEVRYGAELSFLELDFDHLPDVLSYVKETWLIPYKEKIVSSWTDRNTHFGMHAVNVVESVHSRLKSCLGSSATSFEAIWTQLRSIVELQLGEIERKLEASQTTVPFSVASSELYIHLKDHVSQNGLQLLVSETKRVVETGSDPMLCGCYLRRTHGLPCAHELTGYVLRFVDVSIPLSEIHPFWKTLQNVDEDLLDPDAYFKDLMEDLKSKPREEKMRLLKRFKELIPKASTLEEKPSQSKSFLGSSYEVEQHTSSEDSFTSKFVRFPYESEIESFMVPYIQSWTDVESDGNCGFRSFADVLGMDESDWPKVRRDCWTEISARRDVYAKVFRYMNVETILRRIAHWSGPCGYAYRMTWLDIGYVIATHYHVMVVILSRFQSYTFLPLVAKEKREPPTRVIAIAYSYPKDHYIAVHLCEGAPIPPIMSDWNWYHDKSVAGWDSTFKKRMEGYVNLKREQII